MRKKIYKRGTGTVKKKTGKIDRQSKTRKADSGMNEKNKNKEQLVKEITKLRSKCNRLENQKTDQKLKESERRFRDTLENLNLIAIQLDKEGKIIFVNNFLLGFSGWKRKDILGKNWMDMFIPEDIRGEIRKLHQDNISKGVITIHYENEILLRNGEKRLISWNNSHLLDLNGKIIGVTSIGDDVTRSVIAGKRLRESENKFRNLVTKSLVGVYLIQDGIFKYCNHRLAEIFGYTPEELINKKGPEDLVVPEDWPIVRNNLQRRISGEVESIHYGFRGVTKNDKIIYVEVYGTRTDFQGRSAVIGSLLDITERKQTEKAILNIAKGVSASFGEEFFNRLTKHLVDTLKADYAYIAKILPESPNRARTISFVADGKIIDNVEVDLSGTPCEHVLEKKASSYTADVQNFFPGAHVMAKLNIHSYVGTPLVNSSGEIVGIMSVMYRKPISDSHMIESLLQIFAARASAEIERKISEDKLQNLSLIAEQISDSVLTTDLNHKVNYANRAFSKLFGYEREEILGKSPDILNAESESFKIQNEIYQTVSSGEIWRGELKNRRKDGNIFDCELTVFPLIDKQGKIFSYAGIQRDITELKRSRTEREILLKELTRKNKELEQIIYVTSHDLRTPMVNIQGFTRELVNSLEELTSVLQEVNIPQEKSTRISSLLHSDIKESKEFIIASIRKMDTLLSGLLRLSRLGRIELNKEEIDMNVLIKEISDTFEFQMKKIGVELMISELPPCIGDKIQINQVFSNLMDNALKYLDPKRPGVIRISGYRENGQSVYCIEDNGIGIDREYQEKIFEIFHQLDPKRVKGEGLGLTIVQKVIEKHDGKIWVESEPGKGSRFFVSLPA
jgi:PAS domain S-box-containing protein